MINGRWLREGDLQDEREREGKGEDDQVGNREANPEQGRPRNRMERRARQGGELQVDDQVPGEEEHQEDGRPWDSQDEGTDH